MHCGITVATCKNGREQKATKDCPKSGHSNNVPEENYRVIDIQNDKLTVIDLLQIL